MDHVHGVRSQFFGMPAGHFPIAVGVLGDNFAAFLERVQNQGNIKFPAQGAFYADLDVVEVYENSKLKLFIHVLIEG